MECTTAHSNPITDRSADGPTLAQIVGRNVTELREREKISKTMFSAMLGIGRPQLNRIEDGTADIRLSLVEEIAEALDTTSEYLLTHRL